MPKFSETLPDFDPVSYTDWEDLVSKRSGDFEAVAQAGHSFGSSRFGALFHKDMATIEPSGLPPRRWRIVASHWAQDPNQVLRDIREDIAGGVEGVCLAWAGRQSPGLEYEGMKDVLTQLDLSQHKLVFFSGENVDKVTDLLADLVSDASAKLPANGNLGLDPIGRFAVTGELDNPLDTLLREAGALKANLPEPVRAYQVFIANGATFQDAGAGPVMELAYALSSAVAYIRSMVQAGVSPKTAAASVSVLLATDTQSFLSAAKFRAFRRLWVTVLDALGIKGVMWAADAVLSWRSMSQRDETTNILRAIAGAFGAAIGGAASISLFPHTSLNTLDDTEARRISRNIQTILREESRLADVQDPAAGSYAIETLTDAITTQAWLTFQALEENGGIIDGLRSGDVQAHCATAASRRAEEIASLDRLLIGGNSFVNADFDAPTGHGKSKGLAYLVSGIKLPKDRLKPLYIQRDTEQFENIRSISDAYLDLHNSRPKVMIVSFDDHARSDARVKWINSVLPLVGFDCVECGFKTLPQCLPAEEMIAAILCGTDSGYAVLGREAVAELKIVKNRLVLLVGDSNLDAEARLWGADGVINTGDDIVKTFGMILTEAGND